MTIQNPQTTKAGNVSEIQRLTSESDRLAHAVDSWNMWYIGFGFAALLVAFLVFFAQWRIISKGKALASVQSDLIAAKDRQAFLDSKNQDERIAAAQGKAAASDAIAGKANEQAGRAEEKAANANERAAKAESSLANAEQHSAEANEKAEGFRADIAIANQGAAQAQAQVADAQRAAAEANKIAESERLSRLQLEARLADRVITLDQASGLKQAFAPLKGKTIDIVTIGNTPEIFNIRNAIVSSISAAGVLFNFVHPVIGDIDARGVMVGVREDASEAEKQACTSFVSILSKTLGGGVAKVEYDYFDASKMALASASTPGSGPLWQSPIRIFIAFK